MRLTRRASLTVRLTVLFAAASTTVLLLLGYLIGSSVETHFEQIDMAVLSGKLELAEHALEKLKSPADLQALRRQLDDSLVGHHSLAMLVLASDGSTLFSTKGARFPSALTSKAMHEVRNSTVWRSDSAHPLRGIARLAATGIPGAGPAVIAVGTDIRQHEHFMDAFQRTLWIVVVAAALLSGFLGWVAARHGLAPLRAMRREVEGITARRLDARLSAQAVPAELAELAETLNVMLARLEDSFRRLSNFSSDLAHELRTPVSNLLTQTQVTLAKPRTVEAYGDILASNAEEFERLSRMISDMLFLAQSDNDLIIPNRETIELASEVRGVFEFYEALSEEKGVALACTGEGRISGDRLMVRRAISNLVSNAVRHSAPGGRVSVTLVPSDGKFLELRVENSGDSIAAEHLPRLFDRFYRIDGSRQRQSDGAGLGLAITRSIVGAHGGDARAVSGAGMTMFALRFPAP